MNVPSLDISQFNILTTIDLSTTPPTICLQAASVGTNQSLVEYIYQIKTPSGALLWQGSFTSPDATGNSDIFYPNPTNPNPGAIPLFNGHVEWSGSDYVVVATMKDTADLEFSQTILFTVCPPRGNAVAGSNFGEACASINVKCDAAQILASDNTNYDYKGKTKTLISKTWTVIFPADPDTGIQPSPFTTTAFNDIAVDITYNGNYEVRLVTIYSYDLGNGETLIIKYTTYNKETGIHIPVTVECYIDLCPLLCEFKELIKTTRDLCGKNDVEYAKSQRLLIEVNALLTEININKECGKPIGGLIAEIKKISGFKCNCDCGNNGVVSRSLIPTQTGTYIFDTTTTCGDTTAEFTNPTGNMILLTLSGKTYVFDMSANATSYGFSWERNDDGCTVTNIFDIDINALATAILTEIGSDTDLKAAFCTLVGLCDPADIWSGVDMKCVYPTLNNTCDYFGDLNQVHSVADKFFGIEVNGAFYGPSIHYNYANDIQINAWLQTLPFGLGATDYVSSMGGVTFTTNSNINSFTKLFFLQVTGSPYYVNIAQTNCGSVTGTDKLQAFIDAFCNLLTLVNTDLYKVAVSVDDVAPDFLYNKLISSDSSVGIANSGDAYVDLTTKLKVDAADNCGGYLYDKIKSNYLNVTDQTVVIYAHDYVITSTLYGAGYNLDSIQIEGVTYPIGILTTNLSAINTALNAIGLGTFVATSPAANLVITSLGNRYVVNLATIETIAGPSYTTFNAIQTNPVSLGNCKQIFIEPLTRTWTNITFDNTLWDDTTIPSTLERSSPDSLRNVFLNINLVPLASFTPGTYTVNGTDPLPVGSRPRSDIKVMFEAGWDGISANATNFIIVETGGLIKVEINLTTSNDMRIDNLYYPTY